MKIKTASGKILDTGKMDDRKAALAEAVDNLTNVCKQFNTTHVCHVILNDKDYLYSITTNKNPELVNKDGTFIVELMNDFIKKVTLGKFAVQRVKEF